MPRLAPPSRPRAASPRAAAALVTSVLALGALGLLPGCTIFARRRTDQPIPAALVQQVKPGMEKADVTAILGAPKEIIFSNKALDPLREHAYVYEYEVQAGTAIFFGVVNFGNLDSKRDRVIVFLDDQGRVSNVASSLHGNEADYGFPFGG